MANEQDGSTNQPAAPVVITNVNASDEAAKSVAAMHARLEELERANKGILNDLRQEREKRQELEQRASTVPYQPVVNKTAPTPTEFVTELATDGELAVNRRIDAKVSQIQMQLDYERSVNWLAQKEKKDPEAIAVDKELQKKLVETVRRYGLNGNDFEVAKRAYDLMKRDERDAQMASQAAEASRNAAIANNAPVSAGTPVQTEGVQSFTRSQIRNMSLSEFRTHAAAIKRAQAAGLVENK